MAANEGSVARPFRGGGAAGAAIRGKDWSKTALGAPDGWPASLTAHVRAMLHTRQPMCIFWGPSLVNLYNDGFLPILGEKHPTAMGMPAEEVWREAWSIVGPQLERVLGGESIYQEELLVPIVRGGVVGDAWWNYSYSPLFDDDGRIEGVLVVCTEITREVESRKQVQELALHQAAARKQADALRQQAEAANRAKDEFLATVSHELRTPLTAILGWARMLAEDTSPERVEKGIGIIERNARAQVKIIDDILDVSRIISGKLRLAVRPLELRPVIVAAIESIRPAATAKGIRLEMDVGELPLLAADEDRMQQVVWNLLANAVKFTPAGGEVHVAAERAGDEVVIVVRDSGKGISPAFLPHVFDRFRQDDASTTKQHAGLGLGLAIVRHLVELHGGSVTASSDGQERGSRFEIRLPIGQHAVEVEAAAISTIAADTPSPGPVSSSCLAGVRVLLVEEDVREVAALVLEDAGAEVVAVSSAAAAVTALGASDFTAIVSDIAMPTEDGYDLMARVRGDPRTRSIPALALTAFARAEDRARALEGGFHDHVAKPIHPARLVAAVAKLAGR